MRGKTREQPHARTGNAADGSGGTICQTSRSVNLESRDGWDVRIKNFSAAQSDIYRVARGSCYKLVSKL